MLGTSSQVSLLFIFLVRVFCLKVSKMKQQHSAWSQLTHYGCLYYQKEEGKKKASKKFFHTFTILYFFASNFLDRYDGRYFSNN